MRQGPSGNQHGQHEDTDGETLGLSIFLEKTQRRNICRFLDGMIRKNQGASGIPKVILGSNFQITMIFKSLGAVDAS